MQRLRLLGLNHTTAPLEVRERLAFNPAQRSAAMAKFRERFPNCEAVLLSTCNRVELYTAQEPDSHPKAEEIVEFLSSFHAINSDAVHPHLYHRSERAMVEHLFSVASSLDSMVLGETQILGQVREAYDAAREQSCTGAMLNPLFQKAIAVGKQVMRETPLAEGRLSIASVAVEYAGRIFDHFNDKTVLCIGAGKMAQLVLRHFASVSPKKLLICNRDGAKAEALAKQFAGEAVPFDAMDDHLSTVDIVITSTGSAEPIITAKRFTLAHRRRRYRPIFLIDIALPRDVESAVGELENVYLYNLDDLQQVVSQTHAGRRESIDSARKIVVAAVDEFALAHRARAMGPVIDQLYKRYHQLAHEELARTLNKLPSISEAEKSHLEELARRIVNKLLHDPVAAMRKADTQHGPANQYVHAMEQLFRLSEKNDIRPADGTSNDELRMTNQ
jgi:glutamyl-tRNA reductase